jgi:hypothetical protein
MEHGRGECQNAGSLTINIDINLGHVQFSPMVGQQQVAQAPSAAAHICALLMTIATISLPPLRVRTWRTVRERCTQHDPMHSAYRRVAEEFWFIPCSLENGCQSHKKIQKEKEHA